MTRRATSSAFLGLVLAVSSAGCASTTPAPAGHAASAQPRASTRAVILVQKEPSLRVALRTARGMLRGTGLSAQAVEVVVCGEASSAILRGAPLDAELQDARRDGVRIVACGIALERSGIDPASLSGAVEVVDNGLIEVFQRQAEGYLSIEL